MSTMIYYAGSPCVCMECDEDIVDYPIMTMRTHHNGNHFNLPYAHFCKEHFTEGISYQINNANSLWITHGNEEE